MVIEDRRKNNTILNNEHIEENSNIDRKTFESKVNYFLSISNKNNKKCILLIVDIDNFSEINQDYGFFVGDIVLNNVFDTIKENLSLSQYSSDNYILKRINGDEFAIFIYDIELESASDFVSSLNHELSAMSQCIENKTLSISASIGISTYPENGLSFYDLLKISTLSIKHSKETGKRITHLHDNEETFSIIKNKIFWNNLTKKEFQDNFLKVYFQPISISNEVSDYFITHYECLLRIKKDDEWVSPYQYILALERTNRIKDFDFFMIDSVFSYVNKLSNNNEYNKLKFSINISGITISSSDFSCKVDELLRKHGIDPSLIIFEITETSVINNFSKAINNINYLKKLGFLLALDDFGVGFSNFNILKDIPADYIKIDGSFIKNILESKGNEVIVNTVNKMAHAFGQKTIAEFVETEDILKKLKDIKVDYYQGYFIGKPKSFFETFVNCV